MAHTITTPVSEEDLEAFLPLDRVRKSCLVQNTIYDSRLKNYRRAALDDAVSFARSSLLPQTITATFRTPYIGTKNFGIERRVVDLDGIHVAFRLPFGPVRAINSIHFLDASGAEAELKDPSGYLLEANKFVRWASDIEWPVAAERPIVRVVYATGLFPDPPAHFNWDTVRVAVEEIMIAKWDARGGNYKMPSTATNALAPLRTSRTYVPGA